MSATIPSLILASASPRRAQLLTQIGLPYVVQPADIDETPLPDEAAAIYVRRMAQEKAAALTLSGSEVVIAGDTIVVLDGKILGKPTSASEAQAVLLQLSGRSHQVLTGLCVRRGDRYELTTVAAQVWFRTISPAEVLNYWATGEPADKAGSYGIQGIGGIFVERVEGSFTAVVGLPLLELERLLLAVGVDSWQLRGLEGLG